MDFEFSFFEATLSKAHLAIIDAALLAVAGRLWEVERETAPRGQRPPYVVPSVKELRSSRLGQDLLLIARYVQWGEVSVPDVEQAMGRVYRSLFGNCLGEGYTIPVTFHKTDLGKLFHEAYAQMYERTDLLTPAQVYRELGIARQSLYDRAKVGKLHPIYVLGETRFLRSEVEAWKAQREQRKKASDSAE